MQLVRVRCPSDNGMVWLGSAEVKRVDHVVGSAYLPSRSSHEGGGKDLKVSLVSGVGDGYRWIQ